MISDDIKTSTPKSGVGLYISNGSKRLVLINTKGDLTLNGTYYYKKLKQDPPSVLNMTQIPFRKGRSLAINLLDGTTKIVSQFDNVTKEFKLTNLGKIFYANKKDRFTVLFPVFVDVTRTNGSIYSRADYMASTTVDLQEIEISSALNDQEQIYELKRITTAWLNSQPMISGQRILLPGYETNRLDPSRELQFNKLSVNISGTSSSVMHRPLTTGTPMMFNFEGVDSTAAEKTDNNCVAFQLSKNITIKGRRSFTIQQLERDLKQITKDVYGDDVDFSVGITPEVIKLFCIEYNIPLHIKWGENKIDTYTPINEGDYDDVCLIIWGDHLYTISETSARNRIIKQEITPIIHESWVLGGILSNHKKGVDFSFWELFTELMPGHFYTRDMHKVRSILHAQHICPLVIKNGTNKIKMLK
jgi:hypothetical protein